MKKYLFSLFVILLFVIPTAVFALDLGGELAGDTAKEAGFAEANETTLAENIGSVIKVVLSFVGTIFLVLTVYAGFLWMTARGNEGDIEKAQDIIKAALIGLVITVGAYSITNFVVPRIVNKSSGTPTQSSGGTGGGICQSSLDCPEGFLCRAGRCIER